MVFFSIANHNMGPQSDRHVLRILTEWALKTRFHLLHDLNSGTYQNCSDIFVNSGTYHYDIQSKSTFTESVMLYFATSILVRTRIVEISLQF